MPGNPALCIHSTRASGAWVQAFFSDACKVVRAFRICSTLWPWCCEYNNIMQCAVCMDKIISNQQNFPIFKHAIQILTCKFITM